MYTLTFGVGVIQGPSGVEQRQVVFLEAGVYHRHVIVVQDGGGRRHVAVRSTRRGHVQVLE